MKMFGLGRKQSRINGYNTKRYRKKEQTKSDYDDYDEDDEDYEEDDETEYDDVRSYGTEINPHIISVLAKKYLDDDEENVAMRVSVIRDNTTRQEYIVFDSENGGLVVKERNNLAGELLQARFDLNKGEGR